MEMQDWIKMNDSHFESREKNNVFLVYVFYARNMINCKLLEGIVDW